jgi:hypothetical protein
MKAGKFKLKEARNQPWRGATVSTVSLPKKRTMFFESRPSSALKA